MAPKRGKGQTALAAAHGRTAAASLAGGALPAPPPHICTAHFTNICEWLDTIRGHDLFHNIAKDKPWTMYGTRPFCPDVCKLALGRPAKDPVYVCAINLFWCHAGDIPAVEVPIRPETVTYLMNHYFTEPTRMPHELCIALFQIPKFPM